MRQLEAIQALALWKEWMEISYAPATTRNYWQASIRFFTAYPVPISEVTEEMVVSWLGQYPHYSSSRRTNFQALRSFFRLAVRRLWMLIDPTEHLDVPIPPAKEPRSLTETELETVLAAAERRGGIRPWVIRFLYYTGARVSEACAVRWSDVESDRVVLRKTKGGAERSVPICAGLDETLEMLASFSRGRPFVIDRCQASVWAYVKEAGRAAGVDWLHPHAMRATFTTTMIMRGAPVPVVSKLLGHQKITTTQRYVMVTTADRREAVALL